MTTASRKHDISVRCVLALVSVSNSEFSKLRSMASFLLTTAYCRSRCNVFRISQEKRTTKTAGKARNLH